MIAGPGVCICNECVELCLSVLEDDQFSERSAKGKNAWQEGKVLKPSEIKRLLTSMSSVRTRPNCAGGGGIQPL